jgi:hypothetical protein
MHDAIRKASKTDDRILTILLETSQGTRKIDGSGGKFARRGDYLRIMAQNKNEELHESILKLS